MTMKVYLADEIQLILAKKKPLPSYQKLCRWFAFRNIVPINVQTFLILQWRTRQVQLWLHAIQE
jgi:hypothetical protein